MRLLAVGTSYWIVENCSKNYRLTERYKINNIYKINKL